MDDDRVTVDDALIITDIDKVIKALTINKRVSITQLQKITGMERATIEKWIGALEDEGYVRVEHRITDKEVIWLNTAEVSAPVEERKSYSKPVEKQLEPKGQIIKPPIDPALLSDIESEEEITPVESNTKSYLDTPEDESAKERVNSIIKKLEDEEVSVKDGTVIQSTEDEINNEAAEVNEIDESKTSNELVETKNAKTIFSDFSKDEHSPYVSRENEESGKEEEKSDRKKSGTSVISGLKEKISQSIYQEDGRKGKVRQTINKYMADINRQKSEIEALKREKERIYREDYLTLESRADADITTLTEKILEKEGRVLELKERILELPVKMEEVEKMRKSLTQIEQEGRKILSGVSERANKFLDEMRRSESDIVKRIEESRAVVEKSHQKLGELRELSLVADRRVEELRARTTEIDLQIDELNKAMRDMLTELEEATEMKVEITEIENRVRNAVDKKEEELDALLNDIGEIKKLEQWVGEYLSDYEKKVDEIEVYANGSEAELDKLRELAEADHLKKYLRSLEQVTRDYQTEMGGVIEEQQSVDYRIEEAKARLNNLISESQNLIKKLQRETTSMEEFGGAAGKAKERLEGIRKTVEEKEKERDRLKEDTNKAKKKRKEKKEQRKKGRKK